MRPIFAAAILLGGCSPLQDAWQAVISPGATDWVNTRPSQAAQLQALGFHKATYTYDGTTTLVACMKMLGTCPNCHHEDMTLQERIDALKSGQGNALTDCGGTDHGEEIWIL